MKNNDEYLRLLESAFNNKLESRIFSVKDNAYFDCLEDGDYAVMGQNTQFLHHALDCCNLHDEKRDKSIIIDKFLKINPEYKENLFFLQGLTHQVKSFREFCAIYVTENKEYQEYIAKDYKFLTKMVEDNHDQIFYLRKELKNDIDFRDYLIENSNNFRYEWFDLPIHQDLKTLSKTLLKDPYAFPKVPSDIQKNVDLVIDILEKYYMPLNLKDPKMEEKTKVYFRQDYWNSFYQDLPEEVQVNPLMVEKLSAWGFLRQNPKCYQKNGVLEKTLENYIKINDSIEPYRLKMIFPLDDDKKNNDTYFKDLCSNKKNILVLIKFITKHLKKDKLTLTFGHSSVISDDCIDVLKALSLLNFNLTGRKQIGFKVSSYTKKNSGLLKNDFQDFLEDFSKKLEFDYLKLSLPIEEKEEKKLKI